MYMQNMGLKKQFGKIWIAIIEIKLKPCLVSISRDFFKTAREAQLPL